ncbi:MAG: O-antigen ligase family protein [bacterium]
MPLKIYLNILKTGIYLSSVSVFLVFSNLLFPYITSKQIFFNVLIEILAIFWISLVIKYPEVRPKKSWITFGLAAFLAFLFVSSVLGIDFNLSFWGDIERMLGLFHVAHFILFYLIIITVFRGWKDWRNLFIVSVIACLFICFYSITKIPYSTIGNTAYVSGYAIFNIYFALILFFRRRMEEKTKRQDWLASAVYLAAALIILPVMKFTHTRGAYVGLGISFLLFFILRSLFSQSKKIKIYSLSAVAAAVVFVCLVFAFPESGLVKNSSVLSTITQISSKQVTFQTRLISWKAAWKDFPGHIFFGAGYGNFAVTFDKYFDPAFYSYTSSETYFDRAHNNLVDIASTAGLASLLAYLSIFAAVFYYLARCRRDGKVSLDEFILLACLFTAYFIQNLAVFDSLATYICLMPALGYVYWLANGHEEQEVDNQPGLDNKELAVLAAAGLIFISIIFQYNIKVWKMLDGTIKGQIQLAGGDIAAGVEEYKKALSHKTPLDRDSRSSLINSINVRQNEMLSLGGEKAKEIADYAVSLAEENVKLNPSDSMMQMQLAQTLNTAAMVNQDNQNKFYFYSDRALEAIGESIKASPGRVTVYFVKAQIYISRSDKNNVIETLKYAVRLNEKYAESSCYLSKIYIYFNEEEPGYDYLDKCLDLNGSSYVQPIDFLKVALKHYTEKNDQKRILTLYERWADLEQSNAKIFVNLSLLYAKTGNNDKAVKAAQKAAELDPSMKSAAEEFIRKLK